MRRSWVSCDTCGKSFIPRLSYQIETQGGQTRHYCSVSCRRPELREASGTSSESREEHNCSVCGRLFSIRYVTQLVAAAGERKVVCSLECRKVLLEASRQVVSKPSTQTMAVLNQKGGTGKTTTSVSLAAGLAERGFRTLLIDLDAQGNVAVSLGVRPKRTLYHVLVDGVEPQDVVIEVRPNLDVLASDQTLAAAEIELVNAPHRAHVLRRCMKDVASAASPYDFVILDCAPSLSLMNQNALVFARSVLVPVSCDYLSLVGVKQILRTLEHVRNSLLVPVDIVGVLPTLYDRRNKISKESIEALEAHFGDRLLSPIRLDVRLKEAPSHKKCIFEYAPDSNGATDYSALVEFVVARARLSHQEHKLESAGELKGSAG